MTARRRNLAPPLVAAALVASVSLSGCGLFTSEYCEAAETYEQTLRDFGGTLTNAAFAEYLEVARAMVDVAPTEFADDWTDVADSIDAVITVHASTNPLLSLEDMSDGEKVNGLSTAQMKAVNAAYTEFNKTENARAEIVADLDASCGIDLRPGEDD